MEVWILSDLWMLNNVLVVCLTCLFVPDLSSNTNDKSIHNGSNKVQLIVWTWKFGSCRLAGKQRFSRLSFLVSSSLPDFSGNTNDTAVEGWGDSSECGLWSSGKVLFEGRHGLHIPAQFLQTREGIYSLRNDPKDCVQSVVDRDVRQTHLQHHTHTDTLVGH